jgi:itaconate CoA-transferase
MLPLDGITVVSVEQAVAAPFATRQLADLGARVIKIERPDGGDFARGYDATVNGLSSYFVWLNRSKQSLTLDLKRADTCDVLQRLIERADVFVQNLAPGAAERLGLSGATLRERDPRLIVCNVSGYGSTGPFATRRAYDLLVQSEVGLLSITGTAESPARVGISVADIAAGMYAYSGILTALVARAATGRGTTLDVSLFDALGEWMGYAAYFAAYSGAPPPRSGPHHASIAPYGPVRAGDGGQVYLGIQNAREWSRFCTRVLEQPDVEYDARFTTNPLRVRHRQQLQDVIESIFSALATSEVIARLDAAQIAWARMNSIEDFINHPQLSARDCWREIGSPVGRLRATVPPVRMDGVEARMGDVPALGQHTAAILEELGIDRGVAAAWQREGAI